MRSCNYGAVSSECPEMQGFRPSFREIGTMQDQWDSEFRENIDPDEWSDLSGPPKRKHFSEPQFDRFADYRGRLKDLPEDDVQKFLVEALSYFSLDGFEGMPLPPADLPGTIHKRFDWDCPEADLIAIGFDYFLCAARGQSRAMHNRWNAASNLIRGIENRAREASLKEQAAAGAWRQQSAERSTRPQLVYFIASESGPIKIGMAANPEGRCKELQTSHHEKLTVLATCEGGQTQERAYHVQFAAHRLHGEWFERAPEILAEIDRLNGGLA